MSVSSFRQLSRKMEIDMDSSNSATVPACFGTGEVIPNRYHPGCIVIDSLNVLCLLGYHRLRLEFLLHVLLEIALPAPDFICIGDANTPYILKQTQSRQHADIFNRLCDHYPDHFLQCTGGTQADPFILAECALRSGCIVSNDRYRQYAHAYPWVTSQPDRFLRLNLFRDALYVGTRRILLQSRLPSLVRAVCGALDKRYRDIS